MTTVPPDTGIRDLPTLLRSMSPALAGQPYVFCTVGREEAAGPDVRPLCCFEEAEGTSLIVTPAEAARRGRPAEPQWARITLTVHSSLLAVGFLAAVSAALAREGISVNPVSAFHHDHLFVPWERRMRAMEILKALSRTPE